MKWLRYFVLLLPLIFSISFSYANQCHYKKGCDRSSLSANQKCVPCIQYEGSGCYETRKLACEANGYSHFTSYMQSVRCVRSVPAPVGYIHSTISEYGGVLTIIDGTIDKDIDLSSCDDFVDDDDDPCGNGKDPATCDMDEPNPDPEPPYNLDDPCGNGKDPATCDDSTANDPPLTPDPHYYDDDYKPDNPPCQIMVNGKCVYDDPNRKDKICSNGKCKCFKKDENGILKEVSCNDSNFYDFYDASCSDPYDPETCSDNWQEDMFPEMEDMPDYNPNSQYDDAAYNFDGLDTSTNLPDAKDIKDKTQEVDLSSWGVNDYFNSSGQCPAPNTVSLGMFGSFELSYEYFCSIARILRTVVIAFAWLTGLLIIAKINK